MEGFSKAMAPDKNNDGSSFACSPRSTAAGAASRRVRRMPVGNQGMGLFRALLLCLISAALTLAQSPVSSPIASLQPTTFFLPNDDSVPGATPTKAPKAAPTSTPVRAPTSTPVRAPTSTPVQEPVQAPSLATPSRVPTIGGTSAPSAESPSPVAPTASPPTASNGTTELYNTTGEVYIQLNYVTGNMTADIVSQYEEQVSVFFTQLLGNKTLPVTEIVSKLLSQELLVAGSGSNATARYLRSLSREETSRFLKQGQPPLLTLMQVSGKVASESFTRGMNDLLYGGLLNYPDDFVQLLTQETTGAANTYFQTVQSILPFSGDDTNAGEPNPPTPAPVSAPVAAPTQPAPVPTPTAAAPTKPTAAAPTKPAAPTTNTTGTGESESKDTLGVGAVVGIVIAVLVGIALVFGGIYYSQQPKEETGPATPAASATQVRFAKKAARKVIIPPGKLGIVIGTGMEGPFVSKINPGSPLEGLVYPGDVITALDDVNTKSMSATEVTELTVKTTDKQRTLTVLSDKGIAGKVSRKVIIPPGKLGIVIGTSAEGPVVNKINPGSALEELVYPGDIIVALDNVDTKAMTAAAITELTVKTANQQRTLTVVSAEGVAGKVKRKVTLPPGKMGAVIDTTAKGPIVHKINPGSPLEGLVFPGDAILAVDDTDTKNMSAAEITELMAKTAGQQRTLTILSSQGEAGKFTRRVILPPGKLGIVIDTTPKGPVVHKIHAGSPLEGLVNVGDVIVAVDKTNTKDMTAAAITDLMAKTTAQQRILTILSDEGADAAAVKPAASVTAAAAAGDGMKGPRKVYLPPGKLGIVIDTTPKGPIVHKVHAGSPLEGLVYPGDIIVAVDDVDTTAMSATAITTLMVQTSKQQRTLTVRSDESFQGAGASGAVVPTKSVTSSAVKNNDELKQSATAAAAVPPPAEEPAVKKQEAEPEIVVEEPKKENVAAAAAPAATRTPSGTTRKVTAPPGKLGIVIDTTSKGPIVHQVNPISPLVGLVKAGDIIVAVDDVDTRAMSASAITSLMVKTSTQKRVLTILSTDT